MLRFVLYLLTSQALATALGLVSGAIINRVLGPASRGDYAELSSWIVILGTIFGCSAGTAVLHFSNRVLYPLSRGVLFGTTIATWIVTAILAPVGVAVVSIVYPEALSGNLLGHLLVVLYASAAFMASALMATLLRIASAFGFQAVTTIAMQCAMVGIVGGLALRRTLDVGSILWAGASVQLVAAAAAALHLLTRQREWSPLGVSPPFVFRMLANGLKIHLATVSTLLYVRVDQLMLYSMAGDVETGFYAVAVTIAMQTLVLPLSVQEVLYPRVLEAEEGGDALVTVRVARVSFFAFAATLAVLWILADPIIRLYAGAEFVGATRLLRMLLPGILCFSTASLLSPYWVKRGHFVLASGSAVALLGLNVLLNLAWIPAYGAAGAVWATNVTYFCGMVVSLSVFAMFSSSNPLLIFRPDRTDARILSNQLALIFVPRAKLTEEP